MDEFPQTTRIFIEAESLNQVYRQRRDRKLQFEEYEAEKLQDGRIGEQLATRRRRDEELVEQARERRSARHAEFARAYNRTFYPELASGAATAAEDDRQGARAQEGALATAAPRKKPFCEIPSLEGERIVLNRVVDTDAEALSDLMRNPNVQRYLPTYLFEKQRDDVGESIRLMYGDLFANKESLIMAVRMRVTGELAGLFELYGLCGRLHKVSVGCRLREAYWGQDIATEAMKLVVGYLYDETDIEIITASVMVDNVGSARVLEKCDFIRTARYVEEDWGYPEPTIVDKWFC